MRSSREAKEKRAIPEEIPDYYKILGVLPTATIEEIRKAYVDLAKQYYPDVYKGADGHERTKEINEAWEWLRTAQRRAMYDACRREQTGEATSKKQAEEFMDELVRQKRDESGKERRQAEEEMRLTRFRRVAKVGRSYKAEGGWQNSSEPLRRNSNWKPCAW